MLGPPTWPRSWLSHGLARIQQHLASGQTVVPRPAAAAAAKSLQSCLTLCNPTDRSPPGSSVHGIFQIRVLEWGAIAFSPQTCRGTEKIVPGASLAGLLEAS